MRINIVSDTAKILMKEYGQFANDIALKTVLIMITKPNVFKSVQPHHPVCYISNNDHWPELWYGALIVWPS